MGSGEIEATLREMLSGGLDLVEGCRVLARYAVELEQIAPAEYAVIAGVESETDDLPVGQQRSRWASDALAQKDREKEAYLRTVEETVLAACRRILDKMAT
jgi:hypothetical protein